MTSTEKSHRKTKEEKWPQKTGWTHFIREVTLWDRGQRGPACSWPAYAVSQMCIHAAWKSHHPWMRQEEVTLLLCHRGLYLRGTSTVSTIQAQPGELTGLGEADFLPTSKPYCLLLSSPPLCGATLTCICGSLVWTRLWLVDSMWLQSYLKSSA